MPERTGPSFRRFPTETWRAERLRASFFPDGASGPLCSQSTIVTSRLVYAPTPQQVEFGQVLISIHRKFSGCPIRRAEPVHEFGPSLHAHPMDLHAQAPPHPWGIRHRRFGRVGHPIGHLPKVALDRFPCFTSWFRSFRAHPANCRFLPVATARSDRLWSVQLPIALRRGCGAGWRRTGCGRALPTCAS